MVEWEVQQILSTKSNDKTAHNCQKQQFQFSGNQPKAYNKSEALIFLNSTEIQIKSQWDFVMF